MAIFDPARQGVTQGTNAMFASINQAMQRLQEQRQTQRNDAFVSKLKGQGLLGISSEEVIDPKTGKVKLGAGAQSVKEHFKQLGGSDKMKDLRKVFGPNATADDVKAYITQQARSRDQKIGEAITRRMEELGLDIENPSSGDIWKVVDKGDKAFKNWYNATDEATRKQLRALGYHPDQEEIAFLPDFLEKAVARGEIDRNVARGLLGVGGVTAGVAGARRFGRQRVEKSYIQSLKDNQELKDIKNKNQAFSDQSAKDKKELKALQDELKNTKKKKARKKLEAEIAEVKKRKRRNSVQRLKYKNKTSPREIKEIKDKLKSKAKGSLSNIGKGGIGRTVGSLGVGLGGWELGRSIGEGIGGETGGLLGGVAGSYGLARAVPLALKAAGRIMPAGSPPTALAKGALTLLGYGSGKLIDYALNEK